MTKPHSDKSSEWMEEFDVTQTPRFKEGKAEIERFVESAETTTYGTLGKMFPRYVHILDDILLTSDKISWNNLAPAPSKVTFEPKIKITETVSYNNKDVRSIPRRKGMRAWLKQTA
jgi:hypothetical protein